jgi:predicted transcriptional regulator
MLTATKRTIRLRPEQERALNALAERRGQTPYRTLLQAIDAGLGMIAGGVERDADTREIAEEVGAIAVRLVELERVLDRSLFVACAAYAYARNAALATRHSDEVIAAEAHAAFERQRGLVMEGRP